MSGATEMQADTSTPPARPKVLSVIAENIPEELKRLRQWVVWRYELRDKWTKPPYRVIGTDRASSTDPETWGSFDDAVTTYQAGLADGVGFVVSSHDDFVGIDLDHCFDSDTGKSEPWAIDIIQKMQSYSEFSPSGEGIRIFVKGALPGGISGKKKGNVEIYSAGRYLTLTGHRLENARLTLETRQNEIDWLFEKFFRESEVKESKPASNGNGHTEWNPTDDELLTKAFMASNGGKIETLFNGDIAGYPSPSEADLALCSLLAFWAHDEAQLDRLFRRSDLMRDKWDEKHGAATYGEITVSKAWESSPEHYESRRGKADGSDAKHEDHDESETKESRDAAGKADRLTDGYPYAVEDGRIVRYQTVKERQVISQPLCNFDAKIKEEIVLDDGAETHREFVIKGRLDTEAMLPETRVMVARFPSMNWVGESWGRRAIVNAGTSTKDHLRVAIQKLSPDARDRYVFTHTGWRKIGNQWRYLSGSTIGNSGFEVDLGTELARYRIASSRL